MLLWISSWLMPYFHFMRVFQYLTFRSIICALTALFLSLLLSPKFIQALRRWQIGQSVRSDGPERHLEKQGTPTMGGILIVTIVTVCTLLWSNMTNHYIWVALFVMLSYGCIGFMDDYLKVVRKNSVGLKSRWKFFWQCVFALICALYLYYTATLPSQTALVIPFFKQVHPAIGSFFILLSFFVIVGSSNAVNLTDGLDGLALMPVVLVVMALSLFAYLSGNVVFSHYLHIPHLPQVGELVVFCSALVGAGLGFLWFNTYPADIFMGDVGSLSLGAVIGALAIMVRQELVLLIMGGVFVAETVSVILQVGSYKLRKKRIFKMAPLHHHFELKGWSEPKVIVRFWIVTVILILVGLATLKLR